MTSPEQQKFIEGFGDHFESLGLPRIGGRLLALLLLSPEPISLDDLAHTLQVSKGSISSNARVLESSGIANRVRKPGDRRDFYWIGDDAQARVMRSHLQRMADLIKRLEQGYEAVPPEHPQIRQRFSHMIETTREMTAVLHQKLNLDEPRGGRP